MNMQGGIAAVAEAVPAVRWNDQRLPGRKSEALLLHPDLGFAFEHAQHLLDGVGMSGRAKSRRNMLLEDA